MYVCVRERGLGCLRSIRQGFWCVYVCERGGVGVFEEYTSRILVCVERERERGFGCLRSIRQGFWCVCERGSEGWGCLRSIRQGFWCVWKEREREREGWGV